MSKKPSTTEKVDVLGQAMTNIYKDVEHLKNALNTVLAILNEMDGFEEAKSKIEDKFLEKKNKSQLEYGDEQVGEK